MELKNDKIEKISEKKGEEEISFSDFETILKISLVDFIIFNYYLLFVIYL